MIRDFPKQAINTISKYFTMTEKDPGQYKNFSSGAMKVHIDWYICQGLGNLCALEARAMFGLMKMYTIVINPYEKNAPLFSFDYIKAMGNHTLLLELYDTMDVYDDNFTGHLARLNGIKSSLIEKLPIYDLGEHWYDDIKMSPSLAVRTKKDKASKLEEASLNYLKLYMDLLTTAKDPIHKNQKVGQYVDGLFYHGGPSTDAFKKAIGEEKTRDLFENIVFNCSSK